MASRSETVAKYMKKAGWTSKSYTLKKDIVEAFKEACEKQGVSQASVLSAYMVEYARAAGIEVKEKE